MAGPVRPDSLDDGQKRARVGYVSADGRILVPDPGEVRTQLVDAHRRDVNGHRCRWHRRVSPVLIGISHGQAPAWILEAVTMTKRWLRTWLDAKRLPRALGFRAVHCQAIPSHGVQVVFTSPRGPMQGRPAAGRASFQVSLRPARIGTLRACQDR